MFNQILDIFHLKQLYQSDYLCNICIDISSFWKKKSLNAIPLRLVDIDEWTMK